MALGNLHRNLAAADMEVGDVVKLTVYLVGAVDAVRRRRALAVFSEHIAPAWGFCMSRHWLRRHCG